MQAWTSAETLSSHSSELVEPETLPSCEVSGTAPW